MTETAKLRIVPGNIELDVEIGTPLKDVLYEYGVEFPCGACGICRGCRVKVMQGTWEIGETDHNSLDDHELQAGYRLSCQGIIQNDITLHLEQWQTPILSDEEQLSYTPREGYGIAVDVGTTTLVAQLVDRQTGSVLATQSAMNPQARYGADLISRVHYAVNQDGMQQLTQLIRKAVESLTANLLQQIPSDSLVYPIVLVGNTVMHHFFCGIPPDFLAKYPFESSGIGMRRFTPEDLEWPFDLIEEIVFLPCVGGFIGSDLLAGVLATEMFQTEKWTALVDLGTNGEILVGNKDQIAAVSTAAGPAFEGGSISIGMRADRGAIYKVTLHQGELECEVLGHTTARGICGSGLVDAVAAGLNLHKIDWNGRINLPGKQFPLCDGLSLKQRDIRQLQLAKAAQAVGMEIVLETLGITKDEVQAVYLAGAFGNYITVDSAKRIGLVDFPFERLIPVGNTALRGAKMALYLEDDWIDSILEKTKHYSLSGHPDFQDRYVAHMNFPQE